MLEDLATSLIGKIKHGPSDGPGEPAGMKFPHLEFVFVQIDVSSFFLKVPFFLFWVVSFEPTGAPFGGPARRRPRHSAGDSEHGRQGGYGPPGESN